jgi:hypothetical protein
MKRKSRLTKSILVSLAFSCTLGGGEFALKVSLPVKILHTCRSFILIPMAQ